MRHTFHTFNAMIIFVIMIFDAFLLATRNMFLVSTPYTWWIRYRYFEVNQNCVVGYHLIVETLSKVHIIAK